MTWNDRDSTEKGFSKQVFNVLLSAYRPYFFPIGASLSFGIFGRLLILGQSNMIGHWVDFITQSPQQASWSLNWSHFDFIFALGIMSAVGFVLTSLFRVIFSRYSALAISSIYDRVTFRTSQFPMRFFDVTPAGRIITRFSSDYGTVFRLFGGPLAEFLSIVFDLFVIIILILTSSLYFVFPLSFIIFMNFIIYRRNILKLRNDRRSLSGLRAPSIAHFAETAQGSTIIRIYDKIESFKRRFKFLDSLYMTQKLRTSRSMMIFSFKMNTLSSLLLLLVGSLSFYLLKIGQITTGAIGTAFGLIVYSGNAVQMFFEWLTQIEEGVIGVERLGNYLNKPIEVGADIIINEKNSIQYTDPNDLNRLDTVRSKIKYPDHADIKIEHVSFRYAPELPWILKSVSIHILPKEKIGIIGRTGSGKSSLIQALFQLYPIEKGSIKVNDLTAPDDISLSDYRAQFSFISQDPVLFQGTIKDNLDPFKKLPDIEILKTLIQVGYINDLNFELLNEQVLERGKNFSLGERQLLCLARAILQNRPIVILDEATSSVDPHSEAAMVEATNKYFSEKTVLIIAHRLSTLEKCDRVLWLDQGQVRKVGSPTNVIQEFQIFESTQSLNS